MVTPVLERRGQRIERRLEELRAWRNAREVIIPTWQFTAGDGQTRQLELGDFWPVIETPVNLTTTAMIPSEWSGQPVELELWLGGEGFVQLSTGFQAGLNPMHHRFPVVEKARGGESIRIDAEVVPKGIFGSNLPEPRIERSHFVIPQREARAYERDLTMLLEVCKQLPGHEVVPFLLDVAERSLSELADGWPTSTEIAVTRYVLGYHNGLGGGTSAVPPDWISEAIDARRPTQPTWSLPAPPRALEPLPAEAVAAVNRARSVYAAGIEQVKKEYPPIGQLTLTGHAHIDLAWLWPLAETRRKIRRTFSTMLDLMERYPDFTFNQSSAQAYAWIEQDDPAVFERIKQRVKEGRWEFSGGMWLESDCNVTGGEALVRQLVYGQRYFERTFGRRNRVAWLPDVFGFSGGMPQLLKGAGFTGFFTIKLNWNEANRFPYDLFQWEGIDGSRVTAHLFLNPGHGYNGNIVPLDTLGTWRNYRQKTLYGDSLLAFGWGDGAGGPTEKMLENYARIKEFPAMPRLRMGSIEEYYANVPTEGLPRYAGELYFELHRGTLTSQARVKELNRASEHRLVEAEAFGAIASLNGLDYPRDQIEAAWKVLLLNQFHDILPGSSISEVYQDSHRQLEEVVATATELRDAAITTLAGGAGSGFVVANASLDPRPLKVFLPGAESTSLAGQSLVSQKVEGGVLVADPVAMVPGLGTRSLTAGAASATSGMVQEVKAAAEKSGATIENDILRVEIGADGTLTRVYDKTAEREALADRANQLWAYVDKPRAWDAWDVDEAYERDGEEIGGVTRVEVTETGPLRGSVRVERRWRDSTIVQTYRIWSGSRRLDIETEIDWHQRQVLLKARFPLAIHSRLATFETMYGVVQRPTHRNASLDATQFEGSGHRFADLSEAGYGVAVLNNAKYGYGAIDDTLTLSLLRGPLYPDALADEGSHRFTYSLYPHIGEWTSGGVTREAFWLNSPLVVLPASGNAGEQPGFVTIDGVALGFGAFKPADVGGGLILRVYEPHGARGKTTLRFANAPKTVERVNLLEESMTRDVEPTHDGESVSLQVRPFEVVTLRLVF